MVEYELSRYKERPQKGAVGYNVLRGAAQPSRSMLLGQYAKRMSGGWSPVRSVPAGQKSAVRCSTEESDRLGPAALCRSGGRVAPDGTVSPAPRKNSWKRRRPADARKRGLSLCRRRQRSRTKSDRAAQSSPASNGADGPEGASRPPGRHLPSARPRLAPLAPTGASGAGAFPKERRF